MSTQLPYKNNNISIKTRENIISTINKKHHYKSQIHAYNKSDIKNKSIIFNNSKTLYSYPICLHNPRDPLYDFKLRVTKSKIIGFDNFHKNYLKINNKKKNFITEDKKNKTLGLKDKATNSFHKEKILTKSKSDIHNIYSNNSVNKYRNLYLNEIQKRGNQFNKRNLASMQRVALYNFSSINFIDNHFVNGSIPTGKSDESYILETKKRKKFPGMREHIFYELKNMKRNKENTPEYFREKSKKKILNNLPEIIDIKNNGLFKFHVFHDQFGYKKEMDKKDNKLSKMTNDKIRGFQIMSKINRINDPDLVNTFRKVVYEG